jgi:hypothetical protein
MDTTWPSSTSMAATMAAVAMVLLLSMASVAKAEFSITDFTASSTTSVAGAYPDLTTDLSFATKPKTPPFKAADGNLRDLTVDLPAGFAGDPTALPQCSQVDFAQNACPASTQIGVAVSTLLFPTEGFPIEATFPVFNMEPRNDDDTAEIAFTALLLTVHIPISVRTDGDYGLTARITGITRYYGLERTSLTIWGIPADPSHDGQRFDMIGIPVPPPQTARRPFLMNPTRCDGPLTFKARGNSYQDPTRFSEASTTLPPLIGCESVPFEPGFSFQPTSPVAGAPSGFQSVLSVPYNTDPDGRGSATLRNAVVTLPKGVALSPSAGAGLGSCDDAHLNLRSTVAAACPANAEIGTAEFDVPALAKPLKGAIYQRQPLPGDLFRIVLVADGFGVHLKIPADVKADPVTGQLTATFADTPQVPFRKLTLNFDGGQHAPLSNPAACGTYTTHAELTPWSSSTPVAVDSSFVIDQGCGQEGVFSPRFSAGMADPTAGAHTSFHMRITRDFGPAISSIDTVMPQGLLADLRGVPRCNEARAVAGTCGSESQVGRVTVAAGAGTDPLFLPEVGKAPTAVFLAGPYKGAPFSLSIVVPAQAGPFDLGTVVVRAALFVDPEDAHVTVKSDPLPTILEGIPLNVRDIRVDIDRPAFTLNPTSCAQKEVRATVYSPEGASVKRASPFRVADCAELAFTPKLGLRLTGKKQMKSGGHPTLRARLTQKQGQANIAKAKVTLPKNLVLDSKNAFDPKLVCDYDKAKAADCPASSKIGTATLHTPILANPLTGAVHLVQGIRFGPTGNRIRTLPTLLIKLRGEVAINLRSKTAVDKSNRLVSTFPNVPDAPATRFSLQINGGKKGILTVTENRRGRLNLCSIKQTALIETDGQNGRSANYPTRVKTPCKKR